MARPISLTALLCMLCCSTAGLTQDDTEGEAATVSEPETKKVITLFSPGSTDSEWIRSHHAEVEEPLKGRDCEQCHAGQERDFGLSLAKRGQAASRDIAITFAVVDDEQLQVTIKWQGPIDDQSMSIMWGNAGNPAFGSDGCWAACHNDMPGMSDDSGAQPSKYLSIARANTNLNKLIRQGNYVEIWQATIISATEATFTGGTVLEQLVWRENSEISGQIEYAKGRWTVTFTRPLRGGPGHAKSFLPGKRYTFGLALNGAKLPAQAHWVSLPMTFSLDDQETDFIGIPSSPEVTPDD